MSKTQIWHNPRCSKSRQTLALLEKNGIAAEIVLYKDAAPSGDDIRAVLTALGISALALIRQKDAAFKALNLGSDASEDELISAMTKHPEIIERPVVRHGEKAAIGRPPESVLSLFN